MGICLVKFHVTLKDIFESKENVEGILKRKDVFEPFLIG